MAATKRHTAEQIVNKLRQVDVELSQGASIATACKASGVTDQTYYRWRREYEGTSREQVKRLKELEKENGQLKRAVANLTLDKLILEEAAKGNFCAPSVDTGVWCMYVSASGRVSVKHVVCWASHARRNGE